MIRLTTKMISFFIIVASLLTLAACGSDTSTNDSSTDSSTGVVYLKNAGSGFFEVDPNGDFTLTLQDVDPNVVHYTEVPRRRGGVISVTDFIDQFLNGNSEVTPTVRLYWRGSGERSITLNLSTVSHDASNQTATIQGSVSSAVDTSTGADILLSAIPQEMSNVTLSISFLFDISCKATLSNNSFQALLITRVDSSPGGQDWTASFAPGDTVPSGGTITSSIEDAGACEASMTFQTPAGDSFDASFENTPTSASTFSCNNMPSTLQCSVIGNDHGQPLEVVFTINDAS